jgi:hypothetical protein
MDTTSIGISLLMGAAVGAAAVVAARRARK